MVRWKNQSRARGETLMEGLGEWQVDEPAGG